MKKISTVIFIFVAFIMVAGHFRSNDDLFKGDGFTLAQAIAVQATYYLIDIMYALLGKPTSIKLRYIILSLICILLVCSEVVKSILTWQDIAQLLCHILITVVGDVVLSYVRDLVYEITNKE